jgi:hypothetical protein
LKATSFLSAILTAFPNTTQGKNIEDLEKHLLEIHRWLQNGSLNVKEQKGVLRVVP